MNCFLSVVNVRVFLLDKTKKKKTENKISNKIILNEILNEFINNREIFYYTTFISFMQKTGDIIMNVPNK